MPEELVKDAAWQVGVRKTIDVSFNIVWDYMVSCHGIANWLGDVGKNNLQLNVSYETKEGIEGIVSLITHPSHIRLTWRKRNWDNTSTLQVRIIPSGSKTTISFHQDKLNDVKQRERMREYWQAVIDKIEKALTIKYKQ
jgi:uncharacterized protein YndB with AHSA1/START domain